MKITDIKEKYKNEWVAIRVLKVDESGVPVEGEVVYHSKSRDDVYERQRGLKGDIAIMYTGEIPKEGYAVAFYVQV
jgi:hypothetical protein